jgi:NDP-sugar pyrophosphorylase family protein
MNSDLLTNINYEDFFLFYQEHKADIAVACIPYQVNVPYAVMETKGNMVVNLREKPTYTHYSNAGIYIIKKSILEMIPKGTFFNATDLMEQVINSGGKVAAYPLIGYWLDIGRHDDYIKAQEDINHIEF